MVDGDHPWFARCGPEGLLRQIRTRRQSITSSEGVKRVVSIRSIRVRTHHIHNARGEGDGRGTWKTGEKVTADGVFYISENVRELFELYNFNSFKEFVKRIKREFSDDDDDGADDATNNTGSLSIMAPTSTFNTNGNASTNTRSSGADVFSNSSSGNGGASTSFHTYGSYWQRVHR